MREKIAVFGMSCAENNGFCCSAHRKLLFQHLFTKNTILAASRAKIWKLKPRKVMDPRSEDHARKFSQFSEVHVYSIELKLTRPIVTKTDFDSAHRKLQKYLLIKTYNKNC